MATNKEDKSLRQFHYLADPICIASLLLYTINRFVLKPHHIGGWFAHGYFNDVLCLPLFVPIILYAQRLLRLRIHDGFPHPWEIFQNWLAFTIVFQLVIPRFPETFISAGDPYDILAYLAGGILAGWYWFFAARAANKPKSPAGRVMPERDPNNRKLTSTSNF